MRKPQTPRTVIQRKDLWKGELQVAPDPDAKPLTNKELAYVEAYVGHGGDVKAAAKDSNHTYEEGRHLLADPRIREAIEIKRDTEIKTAGATRAWDVMNSLLTDPAAPAQVRFQAAKWTLEASGHGLSAVAASLQLGLKKGKKELHDLSVAELEDIVRRGRQTFDTLKQTVDAVVIDHQRTIDLPPIEPKE